MKKDLSGLLFIVGVVLVLGFILQKMRFVFFVRLDLFQFILIAIAAILVIYLILKSFFIKKEKGK